MQKRNIIFIFAFVVAIGVAGIYLYYLRNYQTQIQKSSSNSDITVQTENFGFTDQQMGVFSSKIGDVSLYHPVSNSADKSFGNDSSCEVGVKGNSSFLEYVKKAQQGVVYRLDLSYGIYILSTPNYEQWTGEQFSAFTDQDMRICSVGWFMPLGLQYGKVFWLGGYCGGVGGPNCDQNYNLEQFLKSYFSPYSR